MFRGSVFFSSVFVCDVVYFSGFVLFVYFFEVWVKEIRKCVNSLVTAVRINLIAITLSKIMSRPRVNIYFGLY